MEDVAGGAATAPGVKEKAKNIFPMCRSKIITLNSEKFTFSREIEVRGFEIG